MQSNFLVIGSGIAGLTFALEAAKIGTVTILTKKSEFDSNTNYAQGGIASVINHHDSFNEHIQDTLKAGAGLCNEEAVSLIVEEGPKSIQRLIDWGVQFTKEENGSLALAKEGGHSQNRIVHTKDLTGKEIERALVSAVKSHRNISLKTNHFAVDLITEHQMQKNISTEEITCFGAYAFNSSGEKIETFLAENTILCSGGAGQIYLHTTNPEIATADGIAMAYRAGCEVENLEFVQFHPTSLFTPDIRKKSFLISEAIRGFGGIIRNHNNEAFMKNYDERGDLAPRDIVARAIDSEMKKNNLDHIFLDLTHKNKQDIIDHFPTIYQTCLSHKIDISKEMIPVVPSAHYMCGGIKTSLNGETNIQNLYACGEVSSTGVHGGNRLASNSLLEAVVFSDRIISFISTINKTYSFPKIPDWDTTGVVDWEEWDIIYSDKKIIRHIMWDYVGIVRSNLRLEHAESRLILIRSEIEAFYKRSKLFPELVELRNLITAANLVVRSALERKESRGLHYNTDYPIISKVKTNTILQSSLFRKHK